MNKTESYLEEKEYPVCPKCHKQMKLEYEFSDTAWEAGAGIPFEAFTIHTLEGDMTARRGDYIIKGVNGEFYPCKADIFKKTYEEV